MDGSALRETDRGPRELTFQALYYPDLLELVNPSGDVGILTLWSPLRAVKRKLEALAPEILDPERSRVAVISNLYGDGMFAMFCNLLFNPQIRHLVALGQDLGLGASGEIAAFLERGLEDATLLGRPVKRIRGTDRVFPAVASFDEARLRSSLSFHELGRLSVPEVGERLLRLLEELPRAASPSTAEPGGAAPGRERVRVAIPMGVSDDHTRLPSDVTAHQVLRRGPLDCWEELVVRVVRFGRPVELSGGPRLELLNARAVIGEPAEDPPAALAAFGFDIARMRAYQEEILRPELPEGIAYTYGNRLRGCFNQGSSTDTLASAIAALRADRRTRRAYISLWDSSADLSDAEAQDAPAKPCLTTLFFRVVEDRLTLTATYRAHNLLTAWLENVYGLMAIQRHVALGADIQIGSLTVISHSLGIDPRNPRYELARAMAERWERDDDLDRRTGKYSLREDPNGYFLVTADAERGRIVAEHRFGGVLLKRYEAERAASIEREVSADMAVSLVSHALWLGRELTRCEQALQRGESV
ncbi:MAG: thymidylate synthase [Solirubrobacterales bacterium]